MDDETSFNPAVRAQMLATEHWSLLATRSQTWSEVMGRITAQFTFASAVLVVLALAVQEMGYGSDFRWLALGLGSAVLVDRHPDRPPRQQRQPGGLLPGPRDEPAPPGVRRPRPGRGRLPRGRHHRRPRRRRADLHDGTGAQGRAGAGQRDVLHRHGQHDRGRWPGRPAGRAVGHVRGGRHRRAGGARLLRRVRAGGDAAVPGQPRPTVHAVPDGPGRARRGL